MLGELIVSEISLLRRGSSRRWRFGRWSHLVHVVVVVVVMMMMVVMHRLGHRSGGGGLCGGGRRGFLRDGVAGQADGESSGGE